jgi:hypothetical protein
MPSFSLQDRIAALSPRERRVLVLLAEALPVEEIGVALGVSQQQVAGVRQALRRKLAVPPGVRLGDFLHQTPELLPLARAESQAARPGSEQHRDDAERRRQLLLRRTIQEIEAVIARARARADALGDLAPPSTPGEGGDDDADGGAGDEAAHLRAVADELQRVRAEVLARVRRAG